MKKYLFLSLVLFNVTYGQKPSKVIIKVESNMDLESIKLEQVKSMMNDVEEIISQFEFQLILNENEFLFFQSQHLINDAINQSIYDIAIGTCHGGQKWYYDTESKVRICSREIFGESFVISSSGEDIKWQLLNTSKKIGQYTAYKAVAKKPLLAQEVPEKDR